jgi:hypothetical protein
MTTSASSERARVNGESLTSWDHAYPVPFAAVLLQSHWHQLGQHKLWELRYLRQYLLGLKWSSVKFEVSGPKVRLGSCVFH